MWIYSELYIVTVPVGRQMSLGEKNVQPDQDKNSVPSEYRTTALLNELSGRLHIFSPK
jgi:hypothetical protein